MRRFPTGGKVKATLAVITVAVCAAGVAPAFADEPPPTGTAPGYSPTYCYKNADQSDNGTRYVLTNGYVDWWLDLPDVPKGYYALRYRTHVAHQNWDGDQYVTDNEWEGVWGGPTNLVSEKDFQHYYSFNGACKNITGFGYGVRG